MAETKQAAALCPLCGGANQCAIAAGQPASSCWCQAVKIDDDARARAADTANERCLCRACGRPLGEAPGAG